MPTVWASIKKRFVLKIGIRIFVIPSMINFRFSLSSHHPQVMSATPLPTDFFSIWKHSLHLKAINQSTVITRCVTVLLFISWFQVATLHLAWNNFSMRNAGNPYLEYIVFRSIKRWYVLPVYISVFPQFIYDLFHISLTLISLTGTYEPTIDLLPTSVAS